jgi:hypothetical protein
MKMPRQKECLRIWRWLNSGWRSEAEKAAGIFFLTCILVLVVCSVIRGVLEFASLFTRHFEKYRQFLDAVEGELMVITFLSMCVSFFYNFTLRKQMSFL